MSNPNAAAASSRPPGQAGQVAETLRIGTLPGAVAAAAAVVLLLWSVLLLVFFAMLLGATPRGAAGWLAVRTGAGWLLGQIVDMITIGVLTWLGLGLLGVPVPLALGAIAGLLTIIPSFGAVLAGAPAVLVALSVSPHLALLTLVVFLLVHLVEGYLISPLIQKRMVALPPAVTVMAMTMTVAGILFGPHGIVLGTPLAAAGMVLAPELYVADRLGDDKVRAGA